MTILVTGAAGFIGFHTTKVLIKKNYRVIGIDNLNNYYSPELKKDRIKILRNKNFKFYKIDIRNYKKIFFIFKKFKIKYVIHLAAQAGVRYSLKNPRSYLDNNINGTFNILECCRLFKIKNLLLASSSSVYGLNKSFPTTEKMPADHPIQFYAATKRSTEIMAHSYSYLYNLPIICLRFFTVYGPWGRPDMALFKFTKKIIKNEKIELYNYGKHFRDFTFIDDVTASILKLLRIKFKDKIKLKKLYQLDNSSAPFRILNISNGNKIKLINFVKEIEINLKKKATKIFRPLQPGDIETTFSSNKEMNKIMKNKKKTDYKIGVKKFVKWYQDYYR
jgi:UDP-glucuronate 4-epimerase